MTVSNEATDRLVDPPILRSSALWSFLIPIFGFLLALTPPIAALVLRRPPHLLPLDPAHPFGTIFGRVFLVLQVTPALGWALLTVLVIEVARRRSARLHRVVIAGAFASNLIFLPFSLAIWYPGVGVLDWESATPPGQGCGNPLFGFLVIQVTTFLIPPLALISVIAIAELGRLLVNRFMATRPT